MLIEINKDQLQHCLHHTGLFNSMYQFMHKTFQFINLHADFLTVYVCINFVIC